MIKTINIPDTTNILILEGNDSHIIDDIYENLVSLINCPYVVPEKLIKSIKMPNIIIRFEKQHKRKYISRTKQIDFSQLLDYTDIVSLPTINMCAIFNNWTEKWATRQYSNGRYIHDAIQGRLINAYNLKFEETYEENILKKKQQIDLTGNYRGVDGRHELKTVNKNKNYLNLNPSASVGSGRTYNNILFDAYIENHISYIIALYDGTEKIELYHISSENIKLAKQNNFFNKGLLSMNRFIEFIMAYGFKNT